MRIKLVFDDWRNKDHKSIYSTEEGLNLSTADFHSGTTFEAYIGCDEQELRDALEKGYVPVFYVIPAEPEKNPNLPADEYYKSVSNPRLASTSDEALDWIARDLAEAHEKIQADCPGSAETHIATAYLTAVQACSPKPCHVCHGKGWIYDQWGNAEDRISDEKIDCPHCGGKDVE